jgi:hypothetical protein
VVSHEGGAIPQPDSGLWPWLPRRGGPAARQRALGAPQRVGGRAVRPGAAMRGRQKANLEQVRATVCSRRGSRLCGGRKLGRGGLCRGRSRTVA